jgi:hypothetical protein
MKCYHCKTSGSGITVRHVRECSKRSSGTPRYSKRRSPTSETGMRSEPDFGGHYPHRPNDAELHKRIGPTQRYSDDT